MTSVRDMVVRIEAAPCPDSSPRHAVRDFERSAAVGRKSLPDRISIRQHQVGGGLDDYDRIVHGSFHSAGILIARGSRKPEDAARPSIEQQRSFPSSALISYVRTGCKAWLSSYATLHKLSSDELIRGMPSEEQTKRDIVQGVRAAISAIASIAKQSGLSEYVVGEESKFVPMFADLLKQYLPEMSLHMLHAIERPLFHELSLKGQNEPFYVNSAQLIAEGRTIVVRVRNSAPNKLGPPPGEETSRAFPV